MLTPLTKHLLFSLEGFKLHPRLPRVIGQFFDQSPIRPHGQKLAEGQFQATLTPAKVDWSIFWPISHMAKRKLIPPPSSMFPRHPKGAVRLRRLGMPRTFWGRIHSKWLPKAAILKEFKATFIQLPCVKISSRSDENWASNFKTTFPDSDAAQYLFSLVCINCKISKGTLA